jgi:hypothetical protein
MAEFGTRQTGGVTRLARGLKPERNPDQMARLKSCPATKLFTRNIRGIAILRRCAPLVNVAGQSCFCNGGVHLGSSFFPFSGVRVPFIAVLSEFVAAWDTIIKDARSVSPLDP